MINKILIKLLLLFLPLLSFSHCYIREYTYNVSENESKIYVKNIIINQLKRNLIEELGVFINTQTEIKNKDYEIFIKTKIISECITKFTILNEKWNGYTYYIKAKICVDEKDLNRRLNDIKNEQIKQYETYNNIKQPIIDKTKYNNYNRNYNYYSYFHTSYGITSQSIELGLSIGIIKKNIYYIGGFFDMDIDLLNENLFTYRQMGLEIRIDILHQRFIIISTYLKGGFGKYLTNNILTELMSIEPMVKMGIILTDNIILMPGISYKFTSINNNDINQFLPSISIELNY